MIDHLIGSVAQWFRRVTDTRPDAPADPPRKCGALHPVFDTTCEKWINAGDICLEHRGIVGDRYRGRYWIDWTNAKEN
jgi:hypothetical protein